MIDNKLSCLIEYINSRFIVVVLTFLLAATARLYRLGHESIWLDESLSIAYVTREYTTLGLIFEFPMQDPHPPLYYLLLDGWVFVFGTSEIAVRLPSALFGLATVILIYALGLKVFDYETGIVAALLLGLSSFHIYHAQNARMYTLLGMLTLASYYFLVDIVAPERDHDLQTVVGYVIVTTLLGYTHVFSFFVIIAQNIYVFLRVLFDKISFPRMGTLQIPRGGISIPRWISIQISLAALLGPWMFILSRRIFAIPGRGDPTSWIPQPSLFDAPRAIYAFFFIAVSEPFTIQFWIAMGALFVLAALAAVAVLARGDDNRICLGPDPKVLMFLALFLVPLIGSYVISVTVKPIFVIRYLLPASLGLFLVIGAGISALRSIDPFTRLRINGRHVILAFVVLALIFPLPGYYANDQKEQWREAVSHVEKSASSDAVIVITEEYMVSPYRYYANRPELTIEPVDDDIQEDRISDRLEGYDEVWVLQSRAKKETVYRYLSQSNEFRVVESYENRYKGIQMYKFVREKGGSDNATEQQSPRGKHPNR